MMLLRLKDMHPVLNKNQIGNLSTRFGFSHSDFNLAMKPYAQWCRVCCPTSLVMHAGGSPQRRADWLRQCDGSIQMNVRKICHPYNLGATGCFGLGARGCFGLGPACVTSLCACLDVVELLVTMKNATVPPALLRDAVTRHVTSRRAAYGPDIDANAMKLHMTHHLAGMLEDVGALYSCWVQERHHRLLTKYAGQRKNTASYERGVMQNITVEQCQALEPRWLDTGLVAPYPPRQATKHILEELGFGDCDGLEVARACRCRFGKVMIGDCAGLRDGAEGRIEVGEVVLFGRARGRRGVRS